VRATAMLPELVWEEIHLERNGQYVNYLNVTNVHQSILAEPATRLPTMEPVRLVRKRFRAAIRKTYQVLDELEGRAMGEGGELRAGQRGVALDDGKRSAEADDERRQRAIEAIQAQHRHLHSALSVVTREADRALEADAPLVGFCPSPGTTDSERKSIAHAIVDHYARMGDLDLAACIASEAGIALPAPRLRDALAEAFRLGSKVRRGEYTDPLKWASEHSVFLEACGSSLEFDLHQLRVVSLLVGSAHESSSSLAASASACLDAVRVRQVRALKYTRSVLPALLRSSTESRVAPAGFHVRLTAAARRLMAAVLFPDPVATKSPYADLFDPLRVEETAVRLETCFKLSLGIEPESALSKTLRAANRALPGVAKLARVVASSASSGESDGPPPVNTTQLWRRAADKFRSVVKPDEELPVDANVPSDLQLHSVLVCPVTRQQCGPGNKPCLLQCGHVVSEEAMASIASRRSLFRCPVCHGQSEADKVRSLVIEY
jgi:E3 ubiquitin-protein transferase RMND5